MRRKSCVLMGVSGMKRLSPEPLTMPSLLKYAAVASAVSANSSPPSPDGRSAASILTALRRVSAAFSSAKVTVE